MPIRVKWDNAEQTCIRANFVGFWDWNEVQAALEQGRELLDNGAITPVDIIINSTETESLLKKDTHVEVKRMLERLTNNKRIRRILIVGTGAITNSFLHVFLRLSIEFLNENNVTFYQTLDDARAYLRENS